MNNKNKACLMFVCKCISEVGHDPHAQLVGYVKTGNLRYITRHGNARAMISNIPKPMIERHLQRTAQTGLF